MHRSGVRNAPMLRKGAKLEVSEVTYEEDPEAYAKRNERLAEALFEEYGNVAITDVGVAVTTMKKSDPVNVETKVTMICLPSFETADSVFLLDVKQ